MSADRPAVSVVVPVYNSASTLGRTLRALAEQDLDESFEVIVVDDGSQDGSAAIVEPNEAPVRVLSQEHRGPGPARNLGAREAAGEVLAFVDADCAPARDWLRNGLAALRRADLVQGAVRPDPQEPRHPLDRTLWVVAEVGLYESANLFVRRDLFERLGGFVDWLDAGIGKPLAEDVWFGWRARRAGARIEFSDRALVHHAVFRVSPIEYVGERLRLVYFPRMAARIPELRRTLFYRRVFLSRRSAAFDLAVVGGVAARLASSWLPLIAALPYLRILAGESLPWRRQAPLVATANLLADATGLAALVAGSVRSRQVVL